MQFVSDYMFILSDLQQEITTCPGLINYSAEFLTIEVKGKGGHTSRPEHNSSALSIIGKILTELPLQITYKVPESIIAFGQVHAGSKANIIPDTAWCEGTLRSPDYQIHQQATNEIKRYLHALETDVVHVTLNNSGIPAIPPVINDEVLVDRSLIIYNTFPMD